jgi:hypothetical protein
MTQLSTLYILKTAKDEEKYLYAKVVSVLDLLEKYFEINWY